MCSLTRIRSLTRACSSSSVIRVTCLRLPFPHIFCADRGNNSVEQGHRHFPRPPSSLRPSRSQRRPRRHHHQSTCACVCVCVTRVFPLRLCPGVSSFPPFLPSIPPLLLPLPPPFSLPPSLPLISPKSPLLNVHKCMVLLFIVHT